MTINSTFQKLASADGLRNQKKKLLQYFYYSLPHIVSIILFGPVAILQGIYTKYYGLSLTAVATVILFSRILDGVTDPFIGYWSDRHYTKSGTRKPFMVAGVVVFSISGYFLFTPPDSVNILYLYFWFTLFILGWTLFQIPHMAWATELASSTSEKTKIYGMRAAAGNLGVVIFYSIPLLPFFETSAITPEILRWSAIVSGILILPATLICIVKVPNRHGGQSLPEHKKTEQEKTDIKVLLIAFTGNKPFLIYLGMKAFSGVALGMWFGLIFIYVDGYLGMGEQFSGMYIIAFLISIAFTPVWYFLSTQLGKRGAISIALLLSIVAGFYTVTLVPETASFTKLVVVKLMNSLSMIGILVISPSILSDIVDYSTWKYRLNLSGTYFSLYMFLSKSLGGIGMALALAIIGWYGFDVTSTVFSDSGIFGMRMAIAWVPCLFFIMALIFAAYLPITPNRHAIIMKCLERREKGSRRYF